jgi:alpha-glucosidase
MYFGRIGHPDNFSFCERRDLNGSLTTPDGRSYDATVDSLGGDVFRLRIHMRGVGVWKNPSQAELEASISGASSCAASFNSSAALTIVGKGAKKTFLSGLPGATFGVSGAAWILQFEKESDTRFYGLGENCNGFEKTGRRVKFWNTDVWADYPLSEAFEGNPAALYASIPWVIMKRRNTYVGILVNHPGAVFMDLGSNFIWDVKNDDDKARASFYLGAPDGEPDVYFIVGPSLAALTRKMQTLVGKTPLPPLWALGYHQCRWGYAGPEDLRDLDRKFSEYDIPADGLWLDIDYMDRYRVFTFDGKLWGDAEKTRRIMNELREHGRHIVPILDPGIKLDQGWGVYDEALRGNLFCLNCEGKPFVGFVWPGKTCMPDFSLPEVCAWWADKVCAFAGMGVSGAWLDMNDPSVGAVEPGDMLFDHGRQPHDSYHNQYALGMAEATRRGFLAARPDERPFLLSRSAFISSSRHTAVWTGDNFSNWHQLRLTIPVSLGLAMSGIPFNGPDVPGFGGDATPELAVAWYKCGFLFPFFRNHSINESRRKEPWMFGEKAFGIIARYIRLRYKLLPYLYNLWIKQEATGEAVMRPLFYECADTQELPLDRVGDQFFIGPDIMQAPVMEAGAKSRQAILPILPGQGRWFDAADGSLHDSGVRITVRNTPDSTPLFVREGAVIPMQIGERTSPANDLGAVELHCFFCRDTKTVTRIEYSFDDGVSYAYRQGMRTHAVFEVRAEGRELVVKIVELVEGYRPLQFSIVAYDTFRSVRILRAGKSRKSKLARHVWTFAGRKLACRMTDMVPAKESSGAIPPDIRRS